MSPGEKNCLVHVTYGINASLFDQSAIDVSCKLFIYAHHLKALSKVLVYKVFIGEGAFKWKLDKSNGSGMGFPVMSTLTTVYLSLENFTIQMSLFYDYGTFQWIGKDEEFIDEAKHYGDTSRIMPM